MTVLKIPEMSCAHCRATIEKTITALDPAARLEFNMPGRTVSVDTTTPVAALRTALSAVGYDAA